LLRETLGFDRPGLAEKPMFGGLCWLLHGRLLCGARHDGILVRLGRGRDGWALAHPDIAPMINGGRPMSGWVWAGPDAWGDDGLRERLTAAAVEFVEGLEGGMFTRPRAWPTDHNR
jgi:hypothetical protein